jgi:hypothetical protein
MDRKRRNQVVIGLVGVIIGSSLFLGATWMESRMGRSTPTTTGMVYVGMIVALAGGGLAAFLTRGR